MRSRLDHWTLFDANRICIVVRISFLAHSSKLDCLKGPNFVSRKSLSPLLHSWRRKTIQFYIIVTFLKFHETQEVNTLLIAGKKELNYSDQCSNIILFNEENLFCKSLPDKIYRRTNDIIFYRCERGNIFIAYTRVFRLNSGVNLDKCYRSARMLIVLAKEVASSK